MTNEQQNSKTPWYHDQTLLAKNITIVRENLILFPCSVFLKDKTPCAEYSNSETKDLEEAIDNYLNTLSKSENQKINREIAFACGEFYYIKKKRLVLLLARILIDGPIPIELIYEAVNIKEKRITDLKNRIISQISA